MIRRLSTVVMIAAGITLTGCGAGVGVAPSEPKTQPPSTAAPARNYNNDFETRKTVVDGTELICIATTKNSSNSTFSCNWELWNKTREMPR